MLIRGLSNQLLPTLLRAAEAEGKGGGGKTNGSGRVAADEQDDEARQAATEQDDAVEDDEQEDHEAELARLRKEAEELRRLRAHNETVLKERKKFAERLKRYNNFGDPEELESQLAELAEIKRKREEQETEEARRTGDTERMLKARDEKYAREMAERDEKLARKDAMIERLTVNQRLRAALIEARVEPGLMEGAFELHRKRMRYVPDDEDPDGFRVVARVDDDEMPVDTYIKNWVETDQNARFYLQAPPSTGGGAQPGKRDAGSGIRRKRSQMTTAEKVAYVGKYGQEAFLQLPD